MPGRVSQDQSMESKATAYLRQPTAATLGHNSLLLQTIRISIGLPVWQRTLALLTAYSLRRRPASFGLLTAGSVGHKSKLVAGTWLSFNQTADSIVSPLL